MDPSDFELGDSWTTSQNNFSGAVEEKQRKRKQGHKELSWLHF